MSDFLHGKTQKAFLVLDLGYGLHHLSVSIEESAPAVGQCLCFCSKEHGGESTLRFPDVHYLVAGDDHVSAILALEKLSASIPIPGKFFGSEVFDARLCAVENLFFIAFGSFRQDFGHCMTV